MVGGAGRRSEAGGGGGGGGSGIENDVLLNGIDVLGVDLSMQLITAVQ